MSLAKVINGALMLSINEGRHDAAFMSLAETLKNDPTNPALLSAMSIIVTLRASAIVAGKVDRSAYHMLQALPPAQAYVASEFIQNDTGHSDAHYQEWRTKRLRKLLSLLGNDLTGQSFLVLGDGPGFIGGFLASLGGKVTAIEGREHNASLANLRYGKLFGLNYASKVADLNRGFSDAGRFSHVIALGVVEVLAEIDRFMESCAACGDDVILETLVVDSTDPAFRAEVIMENVTDDNPLDNRAVRPSPAYIERKFDELGFSVERHFDKALNAPGHQYDWEHQDTGRANEATRRFWRFQKR